MEEQEQPSVETTESKPVEEPSSATTETTDAPSEEATPTTEVQEVAVEEGLKRNFRKERVGKVTSNKMNKTITVIVERKLKHPIYGKFLTKTKKFLVHDEKEECNEGDTVKIMECRPLSKRKRWRLVEILERAK